ncbi:hypothetical protein FHX81_7813 [Saccharothrix saharensis]|uniref:Thioesterase domain-containing protein n=1 Tax=Saccharothrix saharensis TaxID=571190 RepID=A0A543JRE4_9PSEU|nr:hypothetical protein [Saccharothrix saharensis]TQM85334.1 hypothetical protein FHX81_7813 [Saccharothrix saharensis]
MELTHWRWLSDRGPDLVLCLDFPGGRAAAGFADLASGVAVDASFLHITQPGAGPLDACVDRWVADVEATGRPVRAVLGYCAGSSLATCVADAVAKSAPAPVTLLFDAVATTAGSVGHQFTSTIETSADHLTTEELDDARALADGLVEAHPDDLPRIAAALVDRYDALMGEVAARLSLNQFFRQQLTGGFTAYVDYMLLAAQGRFDTRSGTPLFLSSKDQEPPVDDARRLDLDFDHADLLRESAVHDLVAELLRGERPW